MQHGYRNSTTYSPSIKHLTTMLLALSVIAINQSVFANTQLTTTIDNVQNTDAHHIATIVISISANNPTQAVSVKIQPKTAVKNAENTDRHHAAILLPAPTQTIFANTRPAAINTQNADKHPVAPYTTGSAVDQKHNVSYNASSGYHSKWNVFGGFGYINYFTGTQNQTIQATSQETDLLAQSSQNNSVGYLVGFQRSYWFHHQNLPIQGVAVGATIGYNPVTFTGQVYQGEDALFNNYTYRYYVRPIDTAAEAELLFSKIQIKKIGLSPYALIGVGMSTVNLTYIETAQPGISESGANSASRWTVTPLGVFGAGLQWDMPRHCFVRTEYRYDERGQTQVSPSGLIGHVPVHLDEQMADILFGYRFK